MNNGLILPLRRPGIAHDYGAAYEVFVDECYRCAEPVDASGIRTIIDLGGNVGYSVLYFAAHYPNARITVWEPHPINAERLRYAVESNGLVDRVEVHEAAASTENGVMYLSDEGTCSSIVKHLDRKGFPVRVEDFFTAIDGKHVDLLKIDVEGAEYALLSDARFSSINADRIFLEWHSGVPGFNDPESWCAERLRLAGYEIQKSEERGSGAGLIWARSHELNQHERELS
jgi:FkbM family methyltransferase